MKNTATRRFWDEVHWLSEKETHFLQEMLHDTEAPVNGFRARKLNAIRHVLARRLLCL